MKTREFSINGVTVTVKVLRETKRATTVELPDGTTYDLEHRTWQSEGTK